MAGGPFGRFTSSGSNKKPRSSTSIIEDPDKQPLFIDPDVVVSNTRIIPPNLSIIEEEPPRQEQEEEELEHMIGRPEEKDDIEGRNKNISIIEGEEYTTAGALKWFTMNYLLVYVFIALFFYFTKKHLIIASTLHSWVGIKSVVDVLGPISRLGGSIAITGGTIVILAVILLGLFLLRFSIKKGPFSCSRKVPRGLFLWMGVINIVVPLLLMIVIAKIVFPAILLHDPLHGVMTLAAIAVIHMVQTMILVVVLFHWLSYSESEEGINGTENKSLLSDIKSIVFLIVLGILAFISLLLLADTLLEIWNLLVNHIPSNIVSTYMAEALHNANVQGIMV
ncbi:hypothetical protein NEOKW01_0482 [Nematocida sp. AWRm80]|nr:hypothetical protein NEOKW01_0482 [Nematocida sp. AWRm80]